MMRATARCVTAAMSRASSGDGISPISVRGCIAWAAAKVVNQTSIRTVNPTGKSYIDSPNISKYGVISKLLTDSSISDEATLFAKGKAYLRELENPMYSYTVKALDFYRVTGLEWDLIDEGKLVRLNDTRQNLTSTNELYRLKKTMSKETRWI